jgi:undecaprenyl-diphosphatase
MHYPSDILVGLIWGGVSGYIAYYVYKNIKRKTTEQDISDKFRYSQRDILPVTTIIAATLVFAIIYAAI